MKGPPFRHSDRLIICDVFPYGSLPYRKEYTNDIDGLRALQRDIAKIRMEENRRIHVFHTEAR